MSRFRGLGTDYHSSRTTTARGTYPGAHDGDTGTTRAAFPLRTHIMHARTQQRPLGREPTTQPRHPTKRAARNPSPLRDPVTLRQHLPPPVAIPAGSCYSQCQNRIHNPHSQQSALSDTPVPYGNLVDTATALTTYSGYPRKELLFAASAGGLPSGDIYKGRVEPRPAGAWAHRKRPSCAPVQRG